MKQVKIDIAEIERAHLRDTGAGAVEDLEDRPIPASDRCVALDLIEEGDDLLLGERLGQSSRHPRRLDADGGIGFGQSLIGAEPVQ